MIGGVKMTFALAVSTALRKYVTFQGRARRAELWYFALFQLILFAIALIFEFIHTGLGQTLYTLLAIALFLPNIAVGIRRLHDIDRSGWWILIDFVPLAGPIILLVWYCTAGTPGPNQFGPDPKATEVGQAVI